MKKIVSKIVVILLLLCSVAYSGCQKNGTESVVTELCSAKSFTVIESPMVPSNEVNVEEIDGEVIDLVDGVAFYDNGELMMMKSGILCKIYSEDLSKDEMVSVISSMQTASIK